MNKDLVELISKYPNLEEDILSIWSYYQNGDSETGQDVWSATFPDMKKNNKNVANAVEQDILFIYQAEIESLKDEKEAIKEQKLFKSLALEDCGIYGD